MGIRKLRQGGHTQNEGYNWEYDPTISFKVAQLKMQGYINPESESPMNEAEAKEIIEFLEEAKAKALSRAEREKELKRRFQWARSAEAVKLAKETKQSVQKELLEKTTK